MIITSQNHLESLAIVNKLMKKPGVPRGAYRSHGEDLVLFLRLHVSPVAVWQGHVLRHVVLTAATAAAARVVAVTAPIRRLTTARHRHGLHCAHGCSGGRG